MAGISDEDLDDAVRAGVLTDQAAQGLRNFVIARRRRVNQGADEENLRFLSSFNDIFVTIGILLFVGALISLLWKQGLFTTSATISAVSWALAEFFTRRKRLALPSITLLCLFASSVFTAILTALAPTNSFDWMLFQYAFVILVVFSITLAAVWAHWLRFRVPITIAVAALVAVGLIVALIGVVAPEFTILYFNWLLLPLGLLVLRLAMYFDTSDTARITRRTDIGFWLHLLAAPLIVHSLVRGLGLLNNQVSLANAGTILTLFVFFACFALVIDRRAVLVSSLIYLGLAFGTVIKESGMSASSTTGYAVLFVGATVLILSAGWQPLRAILLRVMPITIRVHVPAPAKA